MKRILITGSRGFIMSHYRREIEKRGFFVTDYDLPESDITNEGQLLDEIAHADIVLHAAAMADLNVCIKQLDRNHDTNVNGTYKIAKTCAKLKKPLLFISTCCVYGNIRDAIAHEDTTQPQAAEPYACSKVAGEAIIKGMPNLDYAIARIGTIYGVGMRPALFTWIVLDAARTGKQIFVDGDGLQTRQIVYIDDLIDGLVRMTEKLDSIKKQTINFCGDEKISAMSCVVTAENIVGKKINFEHRAQRYGQTLNENISNVKAWELLGWKPKTSFFDGMKYAYDNDPTFKD